MRLRPGETEAVGRRMVTVPDAVRQLLDACPDVTGRPRVIAIDGRAAPERRLWPPTEDPAEGQGRVVPGFFPLGERPWPGSPRE